MKRISFLSILVALATQCVSIKASADLVIFSYNRPMQLYALLESVEQYVTHIDQTRVIYRASDDHFEHGYSEVKERFNKVTYYQQGSNPHADFKQLTMKATFQSPNNYVLFAVDDIVVTQTVDLDVCTQYLEKTKAYGFYLRLGKNINKSYACYDQYTPVPACECIAPGIYQFNCDHGSGDWAYPNTVDMTIYRKDDIKNVFESLDFHNPNTLEFHWAMRAHMNVCGLCFERSAMVNTPLNIVNENWSNRAENDYDANALLNIFNEGLKIDIQPLSYIVNESPHMAYVPTFVQR